MLMLIIAYIVDSQNSKILIPVLTKIKTIVSDPKANIRDPSPVIFDPITQTWNFWATHIPIQYGASGYDGTIHHYYSKQLTLTFNSSGMAINRSSNPSDFDYHGVFTPGVTYNKQTNE